MSELKLAEGMEQEQSTDLSNMMDVLGQGDASSAGFTATEEGEVASTGPTRDMTFQHMEYLTQCQGVSPLPASYLPPWHLTNGHIRYHSNNLTFNGLGSSSMQYVPAQPRPMDLFGAGFSGYLNQFRYPNTTAPFAHFTNTSSGSPPPGFSRRTPKLEHNNNGCFGLGADSNNWRSSASGQIPDASPAFNFAQRARAEAQKKTEPSPWRSNSVGETMNENTDMVRRHELFEGQLLKFPRLPVEMHLKIQQQYGNQIVAYFDVGLVRFQACNIVETVKCHVIFTTKAETGQYWLMAFSKKGRNGVMKFNRLLTPHLKVATAGNTAIEIAPSKSSPVDGGQYVFSFTSAYEAAKFLETLNSFRSKIWNHEELRLASARNTATTDQSLTNAMMSDAQQVIANLDAAEQAIAKMAEAEEAYTNMEADAEGVAGMTTEEAIASLTATTSSTSSDSGSGSGDRSSPKPTMPEFKPPAYYKAPGAKKRAKYTKGRGPRHVSGIDSIYGPSTPCKTIFQNLRMDGPTFTMEESWKLRQSPCPKIPVVVFTMSSPATLFVKTRTDFTLLGIGTVKIISLIGSYHQLEFVGPREEVICNHNIYTWNKLTISLDPATQKWVCTWTAAADLLNSPSSFPSSHNFKLELDDEASAKALEAAFSQSTEVAKLLLPRPSGNATCSTAPISAISI